MYQDSFKHQGQRKKLVDILIKEGIQDPKVLAAIAKIPRHQFILDSLVEFAYENRAVTIDEEQTISQPYTVAFQTELLKINKGDKVLEIGTGSGYQAAVLHECGAKVFSIERISKLHHKTSLFLKEIGYGLIKLRFGDGYEGWPDYAPFDKIIITAAPENIPKKLIDQLKIGGLMVMPIGNQSGTQKMQLLTKTSETQYTMEEKGEFRFVPMLNSKEIKSRHHF